MYVSLNCIVYYILDAAIVVGRSELYSYYDLYFICVITLNLWSVFNCDDERKIFEVKFYNCYC